MIRDKAQGYADKMAPELGLIHNRSGEAFKDGAFWACEEILSSLSLACGFKKRDSKYLDTLREIINRIEGHKDERIVHEGTTEEKQAAPGNQRAKR